MNSIQTFSIAALSAFTLVGCQGTPTTPVRQAVTRQGNAIPAVAVQHGLTLVDLTGGDLGISGGFLVGAAPDKIRGRQRDQALAAARSAEESPARIQLVHAVANADLNGDGFVTLDEVLALARAGLSDDEVAGRLRRTGYVFQITPQQERFLTDRGVSQKIVAALRSLADAHGPLPEPLPPASIH